MKKFILFSMCFICLNSYSLEASRCLMAEVVSKKFTLDIANNRLDEAWNVFYKKNTTRKEFEKKVKDALSDFYELKTDFSFSSRGLNNGECNKDSFRDHRVLLSIEKWEQSGRYKGISIYLIRTKKNGWQVANISPFKLSV